MPVSSRSFKSALRTAAASISKAQLQVRLAQSQLEAVRHTPGVKAMDDLYLTANNEKLALEKVANGE